MAHSRWHESKPPPALHLSDSVSVSGYNLTAVTTFGTAPGKAQPISVSRPSASVEELIESAFVEDLVVAAGHGALSEDLALAMLRRRDLPAAAIEALTRNHLVMKHRKVLVQVAQHPRTPRHVSLPMLRRLFTFELMHLALTPSVAADVKLVADEVLMGKLETIALGERITLARQASAPVAGALLLQAERAVIEAGLQNPRITEASIVKSLAKPDVPELLLSMLTEHPKWSLRREILVAILRRPEASETTVLEIATRIPRPALYELLQQVRLPPGREELLRRAMIRSQQP